MTSQVSKTGMVGGPGLGSSAPAIHDFVTLPLVMFG